MLFSFLIGFLETEDMYGGSCGWFWRCLDCGTWFCSGCENCPCGSHRISIEGLTPEEIISFKTQRLTQIQGTFLQWLGIKLRNCTIHRTLIKNASKLTSDLSI